MDWLFCKLNEQLSATNESAPVRAELSMEDAGVSIFKPRHLVQVYYPCVYLLQPQGEVFSAVALSNSQSRIEPEPLVDDLAVIAQASRDNACETSFYSAPKGHFTDDARLLHDMKLATSGHGETHLEAVTYEIQEATASVDMIRLSRRTIFRLPSGKEYPSAAQYEMQMPVFDAAMDQEQWMLDLEDIIHGKSDRAVRHAEFRLEMQDIFNMPISTWKSARRMPYEELLPTVSKPLSLTQLSADEQCTPEATGCPHCRHKIFSDEAATDWLKFGVKDKAYERDERSDDWENHERSCADLDKHAAEVNMKIFKVDSTALYRFWETLVAGALHESPRSTPLHLQPARSPEMGLLNDTLKAALHKLDGQALPTKAIFTKLVEQIDHVFAQQNLPCDRDKTQSQDNLVQVERCSTPEDLGLRPGFVSVNAKLEGTTRMDCENTTTQT
ncbi:hypothetical protein LTR85_003479 [Meristemomyces frigidus]|nr:hypothetical protein LTR85_003479 [Meristemomyces frigidus]